MRNEAHAVWQLAAEAYAGAETDPGLNAAAALLGTEPRRARPSSWRAEEGTLHVGSSTCKAATSSEAAAIAY